LFKDTITFKKYISVVFFITLGAIAYEIEQLWTERTFDYLDIIASIIAAVIAIVLYQKVFFL
jgi:arginine exporter protein ArgO